MYNIEKYIKSHSGYAGVKVMIHSPTLVKIMNKHGVEGFSDADDIFGDDCWYMVTDEQKMLPPSDLSELREWLLTFFRIFGTYPLDRPMYEYEYPLEAPTRSSLYANIYKNIDKIIEESQEMYIVCFAYDYDLEGSRCRYIDKKLEIDPVEIEDVVEFIREYDLEDDVDLEDAGW